MLAGRVCLTRLWGRTAAAASTGHFGRGLKTTTEAAAESHEAETKQGRPGKALAAASGSKSAEALREDTAGGMAKAKTSADGEYMNFNSP